MNLNDWSFLIIVIFLILDLMIAATRVSLSSASTLKLAVLQEEKPASARRAIALHESSRLVAVLRLSQTVMRFGIAIGGYLYLQAWTLDAPRAWLLQLLGLLALAIVILLIEFTVEANALADPEEWTLRLSSFAQFLVIIFTPFVLLPLLLLDPQHVSRGTMAQMTEDELKSWVQTDEESGSLEPEERRMIYEIFQLSETIAREIMVPRIDVLALDQRDATLASAVQAFLNSGYSRLPVYDENIDNILGFLYAKDLLSTLKAEEKDVNLRTLLRKAHFVPETKKAGDLLTEMQKERFHMAIVVDEYGGVSGVVTLEDIIEEIIGEIQDEYDDLEEKDYEKVSDGEYLFRGGIDLDDFAEIMDMDIPEGDADTLAGYLYEKLGSVPEGGETVRDSGLLLTIEQVAGRRIHRVRVVDETNPIGTEEEEDE